MKIREFLAFVCLSLLVYAAATVSNESKASPPKPVDVLIMGEGGPGKCSGVVVSHKALLTARHCLLGEKMVSVKVNGTTTPHETYIEDGKDHLLILFKDRTFKGKVSLRKGSVSQGEEVWYVGSPAIFQSLIRKGYIAGGDNIASESFPGAYLVDVNGFFGDSGSGLFDKRGRLIGIVSYMRHWSDPMQGGYLKFMGVIPFAFTAEQWHEAGVRR